MELFDIYNKDEFLSLDFGLAEFSPVKIDESVPLFLVVSRFDIRISDFTSYITLSGLNPKPGPMDQDSCFGWHGLSICASRESP